MALGSFELADFSLHIYSHLIYEKDATIFSGKKEVFSINVDETIRYPCAKVNFDSDFYLQAVLGKTNKQTKKPNVCVCV